MKKQFVMSLLLLFLVSAVSSTQHDIRGKAESSTLAWLAMVDSGRHAKSWEDAALMFQKKSPKPDWLAIIRNLRTPLGLVNSRYVATATYTTNLSDAPDGHYIIFVFYTSFEHKILTIETITTTKEADNKWRVSRYAIE